MKTRSEILRANDKMLSAAYFGGYFPPVPNPTVLGGAIARDPAAPGYLVARARGDLYRVSWDDAGRMKVEDLGLRVPVNYREFQADVRARAPTWGFRVADIAARREAAATRLYVAHHSWVRSRQCFVLRVSTLPDPIPHAQDVKVYRAAVQLEFDNSGGTLRPGMNATVEIAVGQVENVLSVPLVAVKRRGDAYFVFKNTPNGPVAVPVELGVSNLTHVEVVKGVEDGDEVWLAPPAGHQLPGPKEPPPGEPTSPPTNGGGAGAGR